MQPPPSPDPKAFAHVDTWVFDLDNTLYPVACGPYPQIDARIRDYIARTLNLAPDEAHRKQKQYFYTYGTSLLGLIREHGTDPQAFLSYVHDVDLACIPADPALRDALQDLQGRKIIFTNADTPYAERVLERLGIADCFTGIFDIVAAEYVPKPHLATYERMLARHGVTPRTAAMVEDLPRNLEPAAQLGMTTVWIKNDGAWALPPDGKADLMREFAAMGHGHHVVEDLAAWVRAVAGAPKAR
jgi:putative hydrolase of the HAD superfamily